MWEIVDSGERRVAWERSDGCARVVARETAGGDWAVSLDRLEQAPEGQAYEHRVVESRQTALSVAEEWRLANAID